MAAFMLRTWELGYLIQHTPLWETSQDRRRQESVCSHCLSVGASGRQVLSVGLGTGTFLAYNIGRHWSSFRLWDHLEVSCSSSEDLRAYIAVNDSWLLNAVMSSVSFASCNIQTPPVGISWLASANSLQALLYNCGFFQELEATVLELLLKFLPREVWRTPAHPSSEISNQREKNNSTVPHSGNQWVHWASWQSKYRWGNTGRRVGGLKVFALESLYQAWVACPWPSQSPLP